MNSLWLLFSRCANQKKNVDTFLRLIVEENTNRPSQEEAWKFLFGCASNRYVQAIGVFKPWHRQSQFHPFFFIVALFGAYCFDRPFRFFSKIAKYVFNWKTSTLFYCCPNPKKVAEVPADACLIEWYFLGHKTATHKIVHLLSDIRCFFFFF